MRHPIQQKVIERLEHQGQQVIKAIRREGRERLSTLWEISKSTMKAGVRHIYNADFKGSTWNMALAARIGTFHRIDSFLNISLGDFHHQSMRLSNQYFKELYKEAVLRQAYTLDMATPESYDVHLPKSRMFTEADTDSYYGPEAETAWKVRWSAWLDGYKSALNNNLKMGALNESTPDDVENEIEATRAGTPAYDTGEALDRIFMSQAVLVQAIASEDLVRMNEDMGLVEVWQTSFGARVCDDCDEQLGLTREEAEFDIPAHPNAVLSGSTIGAYGKLQEMVGSDYHGPAVLIETTQDRNLTIGPNHPILTRRGMVRACELAEGDELVYDLRCENGRVSGLDFEKMPMVENVFEAGLSSGGLARISTARDDFHGDRTFCKGEIKVIKPTYGLLPIFDSVGIENFRESGFVGPDMEKMILPRNSSGHLNFTRINLPSPSGMGGVLSTHFVLFKIQRIHYIQFVGRAFDATTETGLYNSNGFVVKNCECFWRLVPADWAILLRNGTADEEDLAKWMDAQGMVPGAMVIRDKDGNPAGKLIVKFEDWLEERRPVMMGGR